jgi:hypothetical protein
MKNHWRTILALLPGKLERLIWEKYYSDADAEWKKNGKPLPVSYQSKHDALRDALKTYKISTLVETGTYLGDTLYMLYPEFDQLYSIELSPIFHHRALRRFSKMGKIKLIQGDSGSELKTLIPQLKGPALFWLDGHYSGGITAKGDKECPVMEELESIFRSPFQHVIYIDDARLFIGKDDYPTIEGLKDFVSQQKPDLQFRIENDCIRITPR